MTRIPRSVVLLATSVGILAAAPPSATVIIGRRTHMVEMNDAMLAMGRQLVGRHANLQALAPQADRIAELAPAIPSWFPSGSGVESGAPTVALPSVWLNRRDFDSRAAAFSKAALALRDAVHRRDVDAAATDARVVDRACVACHMAYRLAD